MPQINGSLVHSWARREPALEVESSMEGELGGESETNPTTLAKWGLGFSACCVIKSVQAQKLGGERQTVWKDHHPGT